MYVISVALLIGVACSEHKGALVANPCDTPITVSFWGGAEPPPDDSKWLDKTEIPALTIHEVSDVFADAGPVEVEGLVRVEVEDRQEEIVKVPGTEDKPVPVVIPATICGDA